ncbi:MAG: ATP-binding cassette domain-containing protein [Candidatus Eisenbacteria bacterium]|nr:ATP-binding cassette domain-containing protein [Candidatus Eisenbacteria bacterium]
MKLVMDNVQFSYDRGSPAERIVLDSVSLEVRERELLSIVGRTGSGKTTLGLVMAGLLSPARGRMTIEDASVGGSTVAREGITDDASIAIPATTGGRNTRTPRRKPTAKRGAEGVDVVMVFQFPESQFFEESVLGELAFGPSRLGLTGEAIQRRAVSAMQKVRLDFHALSTRSPLSLSDGEKRKVAIASALTCGPRFLILDEPTVSLDWEAAVHTFEVLRELTQSGVSVIVMTHEVEDVLAYSDRIAVLTEGRLVALGRLSRDEIYRVLSRDEAPTSGGSLTSRGRKS